MNGKISDQPVVELMRQISSLGLSGTLRLEQDRAKAAVYFEEGSTVFAASNIRTFRLREYVMKRELLNDSQLALLNDNRSDSALASMLTTKGLLDEQTVSNLFASMIADLVRVVLLWFSGTWEFDDRSRLADSLRVKLDTSVLLLETSRKMETKFVNSRFFNDEELISPGVHPTDSVSLLPMEAFVLSRVDRPTSLTEVTMLSSMSEEEAKRTIYGLALAGYLQRESWPRVWGTGSIKPKPVAKPPEPKMPEPVVKSEEEQLEEFFDRLKFSTNHYEILNVAESAEVDEIKRAYYMLARSYHPDKFHSNAELHARVESAFARITQAYETVIDPRRRSAYNSKLTAQRKSKRMADSAPKARTDAPSNDGVTKTSTSANTGVRAEESFKEGYAAFQLGQTNLAITHLAAAAQAAPQEARFRAYYGQALATQGRSQRLAEMELQAAVKLEPRNAEYRAMLAQLYYDLGFHKRARAEVDRAVELDANNSTAQTLLRKMGTK